MEDYILELSQINKVYGNGVVANRDINISFRKGEIHSIVGENGAGKSTLMKIIFGIEQASSGTMRYKGKEVTFSGSMEAIEAGIGMVHQHFMLIPSYTAADSIILGNEPKKMKIFTDHKTAVKRTQELSDQYQFGIDVTKKISDLSVGEKQKVEILKTLYRNAEVIILDEPTSVLTPQETELLFRQLMHFKETGHTILFISHKLNEVKRISDRITIMRNGSGRGTYNAEDISLEEMARLIVGREVAADYSHLRREVPEQKTILEVKDLSLTQNGVPVLDKVSFSVKSGEILGIAGVQGNGQSELIRCITGLIDYGSGTVVVDGKDITHLNIHDKRQSGLAYIPEDRMEDGSAGAASITDNAISTFYERPDLNKGPFLKIKKIQEETEMLIDKFSVKAKNARQRIDSLSGGNIQKVVVAREYHANPKCLIAEQPVHGIDIGSAEFIHIQLIELRNQGAGILLVSADINEVINLSDRILVMYEGKIAGCFEDPAKFDEKELGLYMLGVKRQEEGAGGAEHGQA